MKKFAIACFIALTMCFSLYADSVEDIQFNQYVNLTRNAKSNPDGMTVCADKTYRIIYVSMPIAIDFSSITPELIKNMRAEMIKGMKSEVQDVKVIKNLKISVVYTFITSDKNIFAITFSYKDF